MKMVREREQDWNFYQVEIVIEPNSVAQAANGDDIFARESEQIAAGVISKIRDQISETIPTQPLNNLKR